MDLTNAVFPKLPPALFSIFFNVFS